MSERRYDRRKLTKSQVQCLGAISRTSQRRLCARQVHYHPVTGRELVHYGMRPGVSRTLEEIANYLLGVGPGRRVDGLRQRRPAQEMTVPDTAFDRQLSFRPRLGTGLEETMELEGFF